MLNNLISPEGAKGNKIGIEIECEGKNLPFVKTRHWQTTEDGSLRNGIEYVSNILEHCEAEEALESLQKKTAGAEFDFSFRTSTHIHVNCCDLSIAQTVNFIYTYLLVEGIMLKYCGESRQGNRFCLGVEEAEGLIDGIQDLIRFGVRGIGRNELRYSSVNLEALSKYGTLEFRAMRGTLDTEELLPWINTLIRIKEFSLMFKTPKDIAKFLVDKGKEELYTNIFGPDKERFVTPNSDYSVDYALSISADILVQPFKLKERVKNEEKDQDAPVQIKIPIWEAAGFAAWNEAAP